MNRVRAATVVVACLIALTGCAKFETDLKVGADETVSGTMELGIDKQLLESSGQSVESVRQRIETSIKQLTADGVSCSAFDDDRYVGQKCTLESVPFDKMSSSSGEGISFRKADGKVSVSFKAPNLGAAVTGGQQPQVNFKITMPGKIIEHDSGAQVKGRTATYDSLDKLGNVSLTSSAGGGFPAWAIILIVVLLLLGGGAAAFFVLRSRKAKAQQGYGQYPGQYPGQPQPGQWGPQYGGQPGQPGQYGAPGQQGAPGQYGAPGPQQPGYPQQGQPGQYGGQPGQPQYPGQPQPGQPQPGQPQYPGQPQPGQWGPPPQQGGPYGQQPPQQGGWGPQQGQQPPQGQPGPGPQQGQPGPQQGGWAQPPRDNDGQA
ncbi:LppM family (lipo)protein [Kribbella sandramycini]|nr:hypothetical protein [Kribbella sandramycini]MBB6568689.1 hypothetical protein [Kribbella sandramycini]